MLTLLSSYMRITPFSDCIDMPVFFGPALFLSFAKLVKTDEESEISKLTK